MAATVDFRKLREQLRGLGCIYLADDNALEKLEWFQMENFDSIVTKDEANAYRDEANEYRKKLEESKKAASSNESNDSKPPPPPLPARLAGIFRLTHKHDFFMRACSRWRPGSSEDHPAFVDIRPSSFTEDPGLPELENDYPKCWRNVAELSRQWYRSQGEDERQVTSSRGVIDWTTKSEPNPTQGFKIGHRVFETRSPESLENFEDPGGKFSIKNWPVEYPEAQAELEKIKETHIAHPIRVYYPDADGPGDLIPPDCYWDELRGAIVRLEFHLNHWFIKEKHTFTADIMRMGVLVRPDLPPRSVASPTKRKRIPLKDDFLDELPRPTKHRANFHRPDASLRASTPQQDPQAGPSTKKANANATTSVKKIPAKDKPQESPAKNKYKQRTLSAMWSPK